MKQTLPKKILRALPTLTEVVDVTTPRNAASGASAQEQAALVERVLRQIEPILEAQMELQLQKAISEIVREQVQLLQPRVRQKVASAIRKAVTQAVNEGMRPADAVAR